MDNNRVVKWRRMPPEERNKEYGKIRRFLNNLSIIGVVLRPFIIYGVDAPFGNIFHGWILWKIARKAAKDLYPCSEIISCYNTLSSIVFEVEEKYYKETACVISEYMIKHWPYVTNFKIDVYKNCSMVPAVRSSVVRASVKESRGMVTGFFKGFHLRNIIVTAEHLLNGVGEELHTPITGKKGTKCIARVNKTEIDGDLFTTDLAIFECEGDQNCLQNGGNKIDWPRSGKSVLRQLLKGNQKIHWVGMTVCVLDQEGKIRKGKIKRYLHFDKKCELYNIVQVESDDCDLFCTGGDSGAGVFFPSTDKRDVVYVFGMVSSRIGKLINVVLLYEVLPEVVKNLPSLAKDGNLPHGVDFTDGLDFVEMVRIDENVDCKTFMAGNTVVEVSGHMHPLVSVNTDSRTRDLGGVDSGIGI